MKVLLKNQRRINGFVQSRLNYNIQPLDRKGEIIDLVEQHPEWQDGTFRIEEVDTKLPWTIAVEVTSKEEYREYIKYLVDDRFAVFDPDMNYYLLKSKCEWLRDWERKGGADSNWLRPGSITTLNNGVPY